jgi:dihydrofolate reductase
LSGENPALLVLSSPYRATRLSSPWLKLEVFSRDGFINDRHGSISRLFPDLDTLRKTEVLQEEIVSTGAAVMGRRAYDMAQGDLIGYEFQVPIFVLTHNVPDRPAKGENERLRLHFITDGIESALAQAKAAAGDKDVMVIGGAGTTQQCLRAGLADVIQILLVPVLLGEGLRFLDHLGPEHVELERIGLREYPDFTDLRFRIIK